ncbi:MAG: phenylalanine--tRNA ligase subunit beta [Myxococcales bacterium]|nr:phenylalanine--tRNA ligase subunit beta [Myxococcales bacterium]
MRLPLGWVRQYVNVKAKPEKLALALTISGLEVESIERVGGECIFEIGVTPNRGDCLSIIGIAREISAAFGLPLKPPSFASVKGKGKMAGRIKVSVRSSQRCPRYCAKIIEGIRIGSSPDWMVKRLAECGVRSINNVVDATNYVMLLTGQPLHAFDLSRVRGNKIVVKQADEGMKFKALDGVERILSREDLMICDGEGPVALAGIMGGENSEVREDTHSLLLESAFFEPKGVRRSSRRLGLASESSRRFERGVDPLGLLDALNLLTKLVVESAGGTPSADHIDLFPKKILPRKISISSAEVKRILGIDLKPAAISKLIKSIGMKVSPASPGKLNVSVPTFRPDIEREVDLIEEVARLHGYDNISSRMPEVAMKSITRPKYFEQEAAVRSALAGSGLTETVLYAFTSAESLTPFAEAGGTHVALANPISADQSVMRTMLLPGLLDVYKLNASRHRHDSRIYAFQNVFSKTDSAGGFRETRCFAGLLSGARNLGAWERAKENVDFYDAKGVVENVMAALGIHSDTIFQRGEGYSFLHPGRFAHILCRGKRVGFVGELHPEVAAKWDLQRGVYLFEINFRLVAEMSLGEPARFAELSKFPFVERDISMLLPDRIPAVEVEKSIQDSGETLITKVSIFDLYKGKGIPEGQKSLAVSMRFATHDRTLTDEEVGMAMEKIVETLKTKLGATLRT